MMINTQGTYSVRLSRRILGRWSVTYLNGKRQWVGYGDARKCKTLASARALGAPYKSTEDIHIFVIGPRGGTYKL